jgi:coenzyme F420-reducing hydrogenase alpha subunit
MIEKFQYYLDERLARKTQVDKEEAKSLMRKAVQRLEYIKKPHYNSRKDFDWNKIVALIYSKEAKQLAEELLAQRRKEQNRTVR